VTLLMVVLFYVLISVVGGIVLGWFMRVGGGR
jgi:hypothetical protein